MYNTHAKKSDKLVGHAPKERKHTAPGTKFFAHKNTARQKTRQQQIHKAIYGD